jgi:hypothetical protein
MTAAPHATARRLTILAARLTDRDRKVLDTLARVRLATTRQLERVHFTQGSALSNARATRRTLANLERAGLVNRLARRVGGCARDRPARSGVSGSRGNAS